MSEPGSTQFVKVAQLVGHRRAVSAVKFSPDGKMIATASVDCTAKIWDASSYECLKTLEGHTKGISDVAWSRNGHFVCTASDDHSLRLWDVETGECRSVFEGQSDNATSHQGGHTNFVFCCNFNAHSTQVVSGSYDETVKTWDMRDGRCLRTLPAHSDPVTAVQFNQEGSLIVSGSYDGICRIWDSYSGACLKTLADSDESPPVSFVKFSPNGKYIAISTLDGRVKLWEHGVPQSVESLPTGAAESRCIREYKGHQNEKYCLTSTFITHHPNHKWIASGSEDGKVYIWELQTAKAVQVLEGHTGVVLSVDADMSGPFLATAAMSAGKSADADSECEVFIWEDKPQEPKIATGAAA